MTKMQMVNYLHDWLVSNIPERYEYKDHYSGYEDARELLIEIERCGMLPPTICYNSVGEYQDIKDTDILSDNDIKFKWEPENE